MLDTALYAVVPTSCCLCLHCQGVGLESVSLYSECLIVVVFHVDPAFRYLYDLASGSSASVTQDGPRIAKLVPLRVVPDSALVEGILHIEDILQIEVEGTLFTADVAYSVDEEYSDDLAL